MAGAFIQPTETALSAEVKASHGDNDTLFIPQRPEIVSIQGAVLNPSLVSYKVDYKFDDYISDAGGFTDNARKSKTYVIYPNGRKARTHKLIFLPYALKFIQDLQLSFPLNHWKIIN